MLRRSFIALWVIVVLTLITVTVSGAGPASSNARSPGSQHEIAKPKFEDIKLQTGMGQGGSTGRGGGFFQIRDSGG
jgi:hypothetical protein